MYGNLNYTFPLALPLRSYSKKKITFFFYNQCIIRKNQLNFSPAYLRTISHSIWPHSTHRHLILCYILWYISAIQSHSDYSKVVKVSDYIFGQHSLLPTTCRSRSMKLDIQFPKMNMSVTSRNGKILF